MNLNINSYQTPGGFPREGLRRGVCGALSTFVAGSEVPVLPHRVPQLHVESATGLLPEDVSQGPRQGPR